MFKELIYLFLFVFGVSNFCFSQQKTNPQQGNWHGEVSLNDRLNIPFDMELKYHKNQPNISIINGPEKIELILLKKRHNTYTYTFPAIDSELNVQFDTNGTQLRATWTNHNKSVPVTIPITAYLSKENRFLVKGDPSFNFSGRWDVLFKDGDEHAIGIFKQEGNVISGTFLTEKGDYRYLAGNVDANNTLYLSCFDGLRAHQFVANLDKNKQLQGIYYNGQTYQTTWVGRINNTAELRNPDSLIQLKSNAPFTFDALKLNGKLFHFTPKKNCGAVIQIMGSWCPNCIDETNYFKKIYPFYKNKGIEFYAISFEIGKTVKEQLRRLKTFAKRTAIPYNIFLGGEKGAKEASLAFPLLSEVFSFPTTIFIDKSGKIRRIHTGFSGPGTGQAYNDYKLATETLLNEISIGN